MSLTTLHALDTCIDPILRFLPAKYRLFLLATCKQLSKHMKAAIKDMIPTIRCMRASGRGFWSVWCKIAVNSEFVSFEYQYDHGDSEGFHRFRAAYSSDLVPRYVRAIWDRMPVPEKQTVEELSIEGENTFATVAVAGMLRFRYGDPMHAEYSKRVMVLCMENGMPEEDWEEWKVSFTHYKWRNHSRVELHIGIIEHIMKILEVPSVEGGYKMPLPIEAEEDYYDEVKDYDEVEEVYGIDYDSTKFRTRRCTPSSDGDESDDSW